MLFIIHRMNSINSIVHTKSKSTITFDINLFKNFLTVSGKVLSLDASKNMIGTALSDDRKKVALSHILIEREKLEKDINKIQLIVSSNNVDSLVIGLPLNKDGSKGRQAQSVITFAANLKKKIELPVLMWDERFSTAGIEREMINNGLKKKNIKKHIDCASATWVLQGVLDRINYDIGVKNEN
mgnify:FL=1